uniref:ABC transmembrane type-1 domain-containing protein n=1 Tax=Salix viminalis TaxID=40686 RepID=A0A6N2MAF7_SALVM
MEIGIENCQSRFERFERVDGCWAMISKDGRPEYDVVTLFIVEWPSFHRPATIATGAGKENGSGDRISQNEGNKDSQNAEEDKAARPKAQLIQEEEREKGSVGFPIYWKYITAAYGGALVPLILLAQILFQILQIGSNYWMAWATPVSKDMKPAVSGYTLIMVYVCLAIGSSFCILARSTLFVTAGYKTATLLFNKMHLCIFRAPMSFFDATPSGRIINRASTDQSAVETQFPNQVAALAFSSIQLLGIIAVMSQVAWQVFIVFIPVIAACIWYQVMSPDSLYVTRSTSFTGAGWSLSRRELIQVMYSFLVSEFEQLIANLNELLFSSFSEHCGLAVTYGLNLNTLQASRQAGQTVLGHYMAKLKLQSAVRYARICHLFCVVSRALSRRDENWYCREDRQWQINSHTTLFRIVEPADCTKQSGHLKSTLDEQIWEALDKCQLGDEVRKKETKLDSTEFSVTFIYVENGHVGCCSDREWRELEYGSEAAGLIEDMILQQDCWNKESRLHNCCRVQGQVEYQF